MAAEKVEKSNVIFSSDFEETSNSKTDATIDIKDKPEAKSIVSKTKENLSEEETQLTGSNLNTIKVSRSDALKLAKETLGIKDPLNLDDFRNKIIDFQEQQNQSPGHGVEVDGKVGKETYIALLNLGVNNDLGKLVNNDDIKKVKISNSLNKRIDFILKNGTCTSKSYLGLLAFLKELDNKGCEDEALSTLITTGKTAVTTYQASPENIAIERASVNNRKTIVANLKEGNIMEALKNPTLLMTAGVLFLFGVFGSGTKYTDGFMKRLGWIVGGAVFGPTLWKEFGGDELMDDIKGGANTLQQNIINGYENGRKSTVEFFEGEFSFSEAFSSIRDSISGKYKNITGGIDSYNESLKTNNKTKQYYIEKPKLDVLQTSLLSDKTFLNTSKENLDKINDFNSLSAYIGEDTQTAINKVYETDPTNKDKDIGNFIKKHLLEKQFKQGDTYVKDIFLSQPIKDKYREYILKSNKKYIDNPKLNQIIKVDISNLNGTGTSVQDLAGTDLAAALLTGNLSEFNLSEYPGLSSSERQNIQSILDKIAFIFKSEKYIDSKVSDIQSIKMLSGSRVETKKTLTAKLDKLYNIQEEFKKGLTSGHNVTVEDFSINKFDTSFNEKKKELLTEAKRLGIFTITLGGNSINVGDELGKANRLRVLNTDMTNLEISTSSLGEIPNNASTPVEFKAYWDKVKLSFQDLEGLAAKYKDVDSNSSDKEEEMKITIKTGAENTLKIKKQLKLNYTEARKTYKAKIETIKKVVEDMDTTNTLDSADINHGKTILKAQLEELAKITGDIVEGYTFNKAKQDITSLWKSIISNNNITLIKDDNSLSVLDQEFAINDDLTNNLSQIQASIMSKNKELEGAYDITIKASVNNINDTSKVSAFVSEVLKKAKVIDGFDNDNVKQEKEKELKKVVKSLVTKYVSAINNANSSADLKKINTNYNTNINNKLGSTIGIGGFIEGNAFEAAYKSQKLDLRKQYIENKTVKEIFRDPKLNKIGKPLDNLITDNIKTTFGKEMKKIFDEGVNLNVFLNVIKGFKNRVGIKEDLKEDITSALNDYNSLLNDDSIWVNIKYSF